MQNKQTGLTFMSFLMWCILIGLTITMGFRCIPSVLEYQTVKRTVNRVKGAGSPQAIKEAFSKQAQIDYLRKVTEKDLSVIRTATGGYALSVVWEEVVPVWGPVSILFSWDVEDTTEISKE